MVPATRWLRATTRLLAGTCLLPRPDSRCASEPATRAVQPKPYHLLAVEGCCERTHEQAAWHSRHDHSDPVLAVLAGFLALGMTGHAAGLH